MDSNTHPILYDKLENPIAILDLAFRVKETKRLKNEWTLDFDYPYDEAGKWALLDTECIVEVKGEKYVLKVVEPDDSQGGFIISCQAEHVSTQTIDYFIDPADDTALGRTSNLLGVTAQTALTNALKGSQFTLGSVSVPGILTTSTAPATQGATSINVQSVSGLANGNVIQIGSTQATISSISGNTINFSPGLFADMPTGTPVGINIHDINMQERNLTEILKEIETTWNGELDWSNRTLSFVSKIGQLNGVAFRYAKNNAKIKRTTDSRKLCTRLYGYGAGGLTIESINTTKYLDSQYINNYPKPLMMKKEYSNIADPESLYQAMKADLALLEKPQITYELSVVELSRVAGYPYGDLESYGLGDYVTVIDERLNDASIVSRINQYERYPYEPELSILQIESLLSTTYDQMASAHSGVNSLFSTVNVSSRRNNRPLEPVGDPTSPTPSISYLTNTDGSIDLLVQWAFTEDPTSPIDGFGVVVHSDATNTPYQFPASITADANGTYDKTIRGVETHGIPADKFYTVAVYAFRYVDQDIASSGLIKSNLWYTNSGNPYQPSTSVSFAGNVTGNIAGTSASTVRDQAAGALPGTSPKLTHIDDFGIYTGTLTAEQINAIQGIILGANASIDWSNVTAPSYGQVTGTKPPTDADNTIGVIGANRLTHIDPTGIYTGTLTAQQINAISGIILGANATIDWNNVTAPSYGQVTGTKPPTDADNTIGVIGANRLTHIDPTGIYTGTLTAQQINAISGIVLGANATIDWANMNSDPSIATAQSTATNAQNIANAIANGTYSGGTFISGSQIFSPQITGGSITSNSSINVTTDAIVGNSITAGESVILSNTSASGGLRWGAAGFSPQIYIDPASGTMHLFTNGTAIYANGQRIDQAPVAVFG